MNKSTAIGLIGAVNLALAGFCAFGCVTFTRNLYVENGLGENMTLTSMAQAGGALYRYGFYVTAALFFLGTLAIFNLSVLRFVEPEHNQVKRLSIAMAAVSFGLMLAIYAISIGL